MNLAMRVLVIGADEQLLLKACGVRGVALADVWYDLLEG